MLLKEEKLLKLNKYIPDMNYYKNNKIEDGEEFCDFLLNLYKKNSINKEQIIILLKEKNIKLDLLFKKLFVYRFTNIDLQFEEKDLIKFNNDIKNKEHKSFLLTQKNINFILKDTKNFTDKMLESVLLNKNLDFQSTELFLENYSHMLKESQKILFTMNSKLNTYLIEKYRSIIDFDYLEMNFNLTDEIIKNYISKEKYIQIKNAKVDKNFIKENISIINYELIFNNCKNEKDCEYYIDILVKENNDLNQILNDLKKIKKFDFDFYINILKKYNESEKYDEIEKLLFFNENTTEKHFKILENVLSKKEDYIDKNTIKTFYNNVIDKILLETNIPLKILEKYYDILCRETFNVNSYKSLIDNQYLSDKMIKSLSELIKNEEDVKSILTNQIKNKKDYNYLKTTNILFKNNKEKYKDYLNKNLFYLSSLDIKELTNILEENKEINKDFIYNCIEKKLEELKINREKNQDYGLSI